MVSFGNWVQTRRNQLHMSRTALAKKIACSPVTIKKIERDERRPSEQLAELMATHLEVPAGDHHNFMRRARGEYVPSLRSPSEMAQGDSKNLAQHDIKERHNLPAQPTPFIGREKELANLAALVANLDKRLITIVASGGMGKTRLALAAAEWQREGELFPQGIYFVSLTPLSDPTHIIPVLAEAMSLPIDSGSSRSRSPREQVFDYLRAKRTLLIMDNFEHLLEGAELISDLLREAQNVQVIVTSRERLHLREEHLYILGGLEFPDWETPEDAAHYTAVKLFLQAAERVQHNYTLGDDDLTYLSRICRLVGGMPLALELAASWVDALSLEEIAAEIQRNLDFLESDLRNVPERQRSMRAVFDASWNRLTHEQQLLLPQLSIFRGGFSRTAVQTITGASLRSLSRLVSKALLQYDKTRERYQIHELLRQYAGERLSQDAEQAISVRGAHATYYLSAIAAREEKLNGHEQQQALQEIEKDAENVRQAWLWAKQNKKYKLLDQAMDSLGYFYEWFGRYEDGVTLFQYDFETLFHDEEDSLNRSILAMGVWLCVFQRKSGQVERSVALLERSITWIAKQNEQDTQPLKLQAFALLEMGRQLKLSDAEKARAYFDQSKGIYQQLDDEHGLAIVYRERGDAELVFGNPEESTHDLSNSLTYFRRQGNRFALIEALAQSSLLARTLGDVDRSLTLAQECYDISLVAGQPHAIATAHANLAMAYTTGFARADKSIPLLETALMIYQDLGDRAQIGLTEARFGLVKSAYIGDFARGKERLLAGLALLRRFSPGFHVGWALLWLGYAAGNLGQTEEALAYLEEAERIYDSRARRGDRGRLNRQTLFVQVIITWTKRHEQGVTLTKAALFEIFKFTGEERAYFTAGIALPHITVLLLEEISSSNKLDGQTPEVLSVLLSPVGVSWSPLVQAALIQPEIAAALASIPDNIIQKGKANAEQMDFWQVVDMLLAHLSELGWGAGASHETSSSERLNPNT